MKVETGLGPMATAGPGAPVWALPTELAEP